MVLAYFPMYYFLLAPVLLFLILWGLRELIFWFFKINERLNIMKRNNELLERLMDKIESEESARKSEKYINMDI